MLTPKAEGSEVQRADRVNPELRTIPIQKNGAAVVEGCTALALGGEGAGQTAQPEAGAHRGGIGRRHTAICRIDLRDERTIGVADAEEHRDVAEDVDDDRRLTCPFVLPACNFGGGNELLPVETLVTDDDTSVTVERIVDVVIAEDRINPPRQIPVVSNDSRNRSIRPIDRNVHDLCLCRDRERQGHQGPRHEIFASHVGPLLATFTLIAM